jgi:pimeloyl-ACP methyl ester carboxylesterase
MQSWGAAIGGWHQLSDQHVTIHGHDVRYRSTGTGPIVLLVHGMAGSSATWAPVVLGLAGHVTVIAPDLLGHGESDKPRGDYSLGAFASGLRDLMVALGHERATIVGHSLGGGIAMQFAYQFPERCERLVLVASGGLGHEVSPLLRLLTLPGAEHLLPLACNDRLRGVGSVLGEQLHRLGARPVPAFAEVLRSYSALTDDSAREAFVHTLRSVVDYRGQRVSASDRLYLATDVPTLIVWGARDPIIPVRHATATHEAIANSRLEIFEAAGHFPHCDDPGRFVEVLLEFIASTQPASISATRWRERLTGT